MSGASRINQMPARTTGGSLKRSPPLETPYGAWGHRRQASCGLTALGDGLLLLSKDRWAKAHSTQLFKLDVGENEFDIAISVISINLRLIGDIEKFVVKQLLFQSSKPKADTAHGGCVVGYCKL